MSAGVLDSGPAIGASRRGRQLAAYPARGPRRAYLGLVVAITVALYYALYIGGGVAPLILGELKMPFGYLVGILAIGTGAGEALGAPFLRLLHVDVPASALGVSLPLLFYYTAVAFGTIYLVTVFHLSRSGPPMR